MASFDDLPEDAPPAPKFDDLPEDAPTDPAPAAGKLLAFRHEHSDLEPRLQADVLNYSKAAGLDPDLVAENMDGVRKAVGAGAVNWELLAQRAPVLAKFLTENPRVQAMLRDTPAEHERLQRLEWANQLRQETQRLLKEGGESANMGAFKRWADESTKTSPLLHAIGSAFQNVITPGVQKAQRFAADEVEDFGRSLTALSGITDANGMPSTDPYGTAKFIAKNYLSGGSDEATEITQRRLLSAVLGEQAYRKTPQEDRDLAERALVSSLGNWGAYGVNFAVDALPWFMAPGVGLAEKYGTSAEWAAARAASTVEIGPWLAPKGSQLVAQKAAALAARHLGAGVEMGGISALINTNENEAPWESFWHGFQGGAVLHGVLGEAIPTIAHGVGKAGELWNYSPKGWLQSPESVDLARLGLFAHDADSAAASTLRTEAPESFKELVNHLNRKDPDRAPPAREPEFKGQPATWQETGRRLGISGAFDPPTVSFPVERWNEYFQSKKLNPMEQAAKAGASDSYEEASRTGGDITISKADYLTHIAGTEHAAGLLEDTRTAPGTATMRERSEAQKDVQAQLEQAAKERGPQFEEEKDIVRQAIKDQVLAAGRTEAEANQISKLVSEFTAAQALKRGIGVGDAAREGKIHRLIIEGKNGSAPATEALRQLAHITSAPERTRQLEELTPSKTTAKLAEEAYRDPNTGLPNERAAKLTPAPPDKPLTVYAEAEGQKSVNTELGEGAGDLLPRAAANALSKTGATDLARVGGGFSFHVEHEGELESVLKKANEEMAAKGLGGFAITGKTGETFEQALKAHEDWRDAEVAAGRRANSRPPKIDENGKPTIGEDGKPELLPPEKPKGIKGEMKDIVWPTEKPAVAMPPHLTEQFEPMGTRQRVERAYVEPEGVYNLAGRQALTRKANQAIMDVARFDEINKTHGREVGDAVISAIKKLAADMGGTDITISHLHGDTLVGEHDDPALLGRWVARFEERLKNEGVQVTVDGKPETIRLGLHYGVGKLGEAGRELEHAEADLQRRKKLPKPGRVPGAPEGGGSEGGAADRGGAGGAPPSVGQGGRGGGRVAAPAGYGGEERAAYLDAVDSTQKWIDGLRSRKAQTQEYFDYLTGSSDTRPATPRDIEQDVNARIGVGVREGEEQFAATAHEERPLAGPRRFGEEPSALKKARLGRQLPAGEFAGLNYRQLEQGAWHGSPHDFENFSLHAIGTGEGHQTYGWGLYFAGEKAVAEHYRHALTGSAPLQIFGKFPSPDDPVLGAIASGLEIEMARPGADALGAIRNVKADVERSIAHYDERIAKTSPQFVGTIENYSKTRERYVKQRDILDAMKPEDIKTPPRGSLYGVELPEHGELLDYDKPISEQSEQVRAAADALVKEHSGYPANEVERGGKPPPYPSASGEPYQGFATLADANGSEFYDYLVEKTGSPQAASEALRAAGVPGLKYLDQGSRAKGEGTHNYVIWDDRRISITSKLHQEPLGNIEGKPATFKPEEDDTGPRGSIVLEPNPTTGSPDWYRIRLSATADKSTLLHEIGHALSWSMHELATSAAAPEGMRADYKNLLDWMGYDSPEARAAENLERDTIGRKGPEAGEGEAARAQEIAAKEEKFSHAFEMYALEGRSPGKRLSRVFSTLRRWMLSIYKGGLSDIEEQYRANYGHAVLLSDEVRGIFDRMLSHDDALKKARADSGITEPDISKMSPSEREELQRAKADSQASAEMEMAAEAKKQQTAIEADRETFRDAAEKQLDSDPRYRAWNFLQNGAVPDGAAEALTHEGKPVKLNRADFVERFGPEAAAKMPPGSLKKGGAPVDAVSTALGFESPESMKEQLTKLEPRDAAIERLAQQQIDAKYGPEAKRLAESAMSAAHNDDELNAAVLENRAKAKELNPAAAARAQLLDPKLERGSVERLVGEQYVEQIDPEKYARAERKQAQLAAKLEGKGDHEGAAEAREKRILNKMLYMESRDQRLALEAAEDSFSNVSDRVRGSLGKADPAYRDVHDAILAAVGLGNSPPDGSATLDHMLDVAERAGQDMDFDVDAVRKLLARPKEWRGSLTVDEANNVVDAVTNIRAAAKASLETEAAGRLETRAALNARLIERVKSRPELPLPAEQRSNRGLAEKSRLFAQSADAMLQDLETIAFSLDGGNTGPWHEVLVDTYKAKRDIAVGLTEQTMKPLEDAFERLPKDIRRKMSEPVDLGGLPTTMLPSGKRLVDNRTRSTLWSMLLNWGSEGNRQRLADGRKWDRGIIEQKLGQLTKSELDFLQLTLNQVNGLYSPMADVHERETGLRPKKVEAEPIHLRLSDGSTWDGAGGYHPAKYDKRGSDVGRKQFAEDAKSVADVFPDAYYRPGISASFSKKRAAAVTDQPIDLSWNIVGNHISQVIHDIAYRGYVKDLANIFLDPQVKAALDEHWGEGYSADLIPRLQRLAGQQVLSMPEGPGGMLEKATSALKGPYAVHAVGWSLKSALGVTTDSLMGIVSGRVRPDYLATSLAKYWVPFKGTTMREQALANSSELRFRDSTHDNNIMKLTSSFADGATGLKSVYRSVADTAFYLHQVVDRMTGTATFDAKLRQSLDEGMSLDEARSAANAAVAEVLPSLDPHEKPAILTDKRGLGALIFMYSYTSKLYNINRRAAEAMYLAAHGASSDGLTAGRAAAGLAGTMLGTVLVDGIVSSILRGRGPGKDEEWGHWTLNRLLLTVPETIPLIGDARSGLGALLEGKHMHFQTLPGLEFAENGINKLVDKLHDKETPESLNAFWKTAESMAGFLSDPLFASVHYLGGLDTGESEPRGPFDVAGGAIYGQTKKRRENPLTMIQDAVSGGRE